MLCNKRCAKVLLLSDLCKSIMYFSANCNVEVANTPK